MFEGFAWLIPLWAIHIAALLGAGFSAIRWCKTVTAIDRKKCGGRSGVLWPFTFAILMNVGFVGGVWAGAGRLSALQTEILGISIARLLSCFCIALSAMFLLVSFMRSRTPAEEIPRLARNFSAFLPATNVAGVFLFALAMMS